MGKDNELVTVNEQLPDISNPAAQIAYAKASSQALMDIVNTKKDKLEINGKTYLTFEDWQTVARFYNCTVTTEWTRPMISGKNFVGYEARAKVIDREGKELSAAEAACTIQEKRWANRDRFQLRSMAQTRAGSKALRNVFAWVVIMAGYSGTPAEEVEDSAPEIVNTPQKPTTQNTAPRTVQPLASEKQLKFIDSLCQEKGKRVVDIESAVGKKYSEWTSHDASKIIEKLQAIKPDNIDVLANSLNTSVAEEAEKNK